MVLKLGVDHYELIRDNECTGIHEPQINYRMRARRDGRPAEYRWRPLFNAAKFGRRLVRRSNAAKTRNPLKLAGGAPNSLRQVISTTCYY